MAENHIKMNSIGLQCVVEFYDEQHGHEWAPLCLHNPRMNTQSYIRDHKNSGSKKS